MKSTEVRERFLKFFESRGHRRVPSSSLIPAEDPTLLFTNAGMNQFKDVFTGRERRDYNRATTAQKCVRAGGKHNDLENVGYTARHHTFFEMLGNFSFGDYFKADAIRFALDLMTDPKEGYGLDPKRLWFTVYTDDDEAAALWEKVGAPKDRILRFGEKDNFWAMGETGPCGPCSEVHYFRGDDFSKNTADLVNGPGDETMEIWNLVFMQYERDATGKMTPLPKPSVDTGLGLERVASILQNVNNNYDTDLFRPIIAKIEEISGKKYRGGMAVEDAPFRVIADHARAVTMIWADGVGPSNAGRGDIVRKIMRRALRYGLQLGIARPFLFELVPIIVEQFSGAYFWPGTSADKWLIDSSHYLDVPMRQAEMKAREESLQKTITEGVVKVGQEIEALRRAGEASLSGNRAFHLYDTFGIPIDVVMDLARDEGILIDVVGYEREMEAQRGRSQAGAKFEAQDVRVFETLEIPARHSEFRGYPEHEFTGPISAVIVGIVAGGRSVPTLESGHEGDVVTDRTVFYPEGGGQVGDAGTLTWEGGRADVLDTRKPLPGLIGHRVRVTEGILSNGSVVQMSVSEWVRRRTQANHTGTHLLHAALRNVLGESARQMGSLVAPDRLRFDYAARAPLTSEQIVEIERQVNEQVLLDQPVSKEVVSREEADKKGAVAFFGEKYGERVRVVDVPGYSTELCGGCHVARTGEIGAFKITSDRGLAAGVRRIEAVTSLNAIELLREDESILDRLAAQTRSPREKLPEAVARLEEKIHSLEKDLATARMKLASGGSGAESDSGVSDIAGVKVLTRQADGLGPSELRNLSDTLKSKIKSGIVAVGTASDGKTSVVIAITPDLIGRISASDIAQRVGPALGGRGGGKRELAQVGGRDEALLPAGLAAAVEAVRELLSA